MDCLSTLAGGGFHVSRIKCKVSSSEPTIDITEAKGERWSCCHSNCSRIALIQGSYL